MSPRFPSEATQSDPAPVSCQSGYQIPTRNSDALEAVLGRVFVTGQGPLHIAAKVISSDETTTYRCALVYTDQDEGFLEGWCSCPHWRNVLRPGQRCKHLDALVLTWAESDDISRRTPTQKERPPA